MKDQLQYWDDAHKNRQLHSHSLSQTNFAEEVLGRIPPNSDILELGCGEGNDSAYFAANGHKLIAMDFSAIAIEQNKKKWKHTNLSFKTQDTSEPLDFADSSFNIVYARLALHYFSNEITISILNEIARVLKNGGKLCFMCKSTNDPLYGRGLKIEDDMFELGGHVRHFFSRKYINNLLEITGFTAEYIEEGFEDLYGKKSAFIKVIARLT